MTEADPAHDDRRLAARFSYLFILGALILTGCLHLATLLLAALFAHLALAQLHFLKRRGKAAAVALFLVLLCSLLYGLGYVINQAVLALPEIADRAIPSIISWGKRHQVELPFTDYDSLKDLALDTVKSQVHYLGSFARIARGASRQFLFLAAGCLVAIGIFLKPQLELEGERQAGRGNFYSLCCEAIADRFRTFYGSFATVMGAQIVISAINTVFTAVFVLALRLPHAVVVIGMTFLCGLLPLIGNLISNAIIVGIAFTVSPARALAALVFLVVIHKLEYLLNSKIIGDRIRNPLWLTLLGLIVGERLMGVAGMILAPVVLNYLKLEASAIRVKDPETPVPGPAFS